MDVGAPTRPPAAEWVEVRVDGKLLFELDRCNGRIRIRRNGRVFIVDLAPLWPAMMMTEERLR